MTPDVSPASLSLRLFGPMQVLVHGQPLPPLRLRKTLSLLALLTLRHDRPVERKWLAGTLWPDMEQTLAFGRLRGALSELRKALGSEGTRLQTPTRPTLFLDLSGAVEVDVLRFDRAISSKEPGALKQAVEWYRGHCWGETPRNGFFRNAMPANKTASAHCKPWRRRRPRQATMPRRVRSGGARFCWTRCGTEHDGA